MEIEVFCLLHRKRSPSPSGEGMVQNAAVFSKFRNDCLPRSIPDGSLYFSYSFFGTSVRPSR